LAKQLCHSTRSDTFLQQEEYPNKEDRKNSNNRKIDSTMFCQLVSQLQPSQMTKAFYQSLWDGPERSTRSLKRTAAPLARTALPPPSKKAKASSSMTTSPEPPSNLPLSPLSSKLLEEANRMIQEAWKLAFPSLRFPVELIGGFPSRKSPLVAAPHEASNQQIPPASMHQSTNFKVAINKISKADS
jgi:hypothetical protein